MCFHGRTKEMRAAVLLPRENRAHPHPFAFEELCGNDPSAGSPTETLLHYLPLLKV